MFVKKRSCSFRIHAVMPAALLLCCWFPSGSIAGNRKDMSNAEKIKIIHQALRTQLKGKKQNLKAEDIFQEIGSKIPLSSRGEADPNRSQGKEQAEKQNFAKEARLRYPAYLIGDTLKISGSTETVTGRYNKRTSRGIWIGVRSIPWADISPECAAQFYYKPLMNLRYRKDMLQINGKWSSAKEYIRQQVESCLTMIKEKSKISDLVQIMIYVLGSILVGSIGAVIGKFSQGKIAMVFGGIIGILIGSFISSQVINIIRTQNINKAVASVLETIVDPEEKVYKFYKIEEVQVSRYQKK